MQSWWARAHISGGWNDSLLASPTAGRVLHEWARAAEQSATCYECDDSHGKRAGEQVGTGLREPPLVSVAHPRPLQRDRLRTPPTHREIGRASCRERE